MSFDEGVAPSVATPPLPGSIWVVAWASLASQVVLLVGQDGRVDDALSLATSVVIGGLLVAYVATGVVRGRTVRLVLAWVVLVLSAIAELVGLVSSDDLGQSAFFALSLTTTALALGGLAEFHRSDWFDWQRTKPPTHEGAPIWQLVAIGALVGALGGLTEPVDDGFQVNIRVADLSSI